MRKVRINTYEVGLVFKNGAYQRMLRPGNYWLWPWEKLELYNTTHPFHPPCELNILLQDAALAEALLVV